MSACVLKASLYALAVVGALALLVTSFFLGWLVAWGKYH